MVVKARTRSPMLRGSTVAVPTGNWRLGGARVEVDPVDDQLIQQIRYGSISR